MFRIRLPDGILLSGIPEFNSPSRRPARSFSSSASFLLQQTESGLKMLVAAISHDSPET